MVLYHWMNYFVGIEGPFYPYLRFVPASFIFISGLILASFYPAKYGFGNSKLYIRPLIRGVKILTLFTLLNIAANMLFPSGYRGATPGIADFVRNAASIYIGGNGKAVFLILVPISYLLICSTLIFVGMRATKYALPIICAVSVLCVPFLDYLGVGSSNLSLVAIGILGMLLGQYPLQKLLNWAGYSCALVGLYVVYLMALNIVGDRYFLEVVGVCLSVLLIYGAGVRSARSGLNVSMVVLLGKYSLLAYIAQIVLLQFLQRSLATVDVHTWALWGLSFTAAFTLTIITVCAANQMRLKFSSLDRMYRLVFA